MKVQNLIKNDILKIIKDAGYNPVINYDDDPNKLHILCMTTNYDVHLQIGINHYKHETVVSAWSWFEEEQDFKKWEKNLWGEILKGWKKYVLRVCPYSFDITDYMEKKIYGEKKRYGYDDDDEDEDDEQEERDNAPEDVEVTAFFRIRHDKGETYRNCFDEIRAAIVEKVLAARNLA